MSIAPSIEPFKERWLRDYENVQKPSRCIFCPCKRLWWNGKRIRSASIMCEGEVLYLPEVMCARVKCSEKTCFRSWTLRPEGLTPQRHYQLDVIAEGTSRYLFFEIATLDGVAKQLTCSRRTVGRWINWVGAIVTVSVLLRCFLKIVGQPVVPLVHPIRPSQHKARSSLRDDVMTAAAGVLCVLESLATALGLPPPGLSSVVQAVVADRYRVTTYAKPFIPDFAQGVDLLLLPLLAGEH